MYKLGPTFMYNWLRPVSSGQAAPTLSRPARVRAVTAGVMDHALQLESFTQSTELSTPYICVHIQVIITFVYTFKLFSTPCTPLHAALHTTACTPIHQVLAV